MACTHPRKVYFSKEVNPSGKRSIVWDERHAHPDLQPFKIPCKQCIDCRMSHTQTWATRMTLEASLYEDNSFLTLTYNQENLPPHSSLHLPHFQKFLKLLRKEKNKKNSAILSDKTKPLRYYHCGEYGEQGLRPHYHACVFNLDFGDKVHFKTSNGEKYYRSPTLERLWKHGHAMTGSVTFESAAYVARYITKKITGPLAHTYYEFQDPETGEIISLEPEYATMSKKPGLGQPWFERFKSDVYPSDFIVVRGKKLSVPKYFDTLLERLSPDEFNEIRQNREVKAHLRAHEQTPDRLAVRDICQREKFKKLVRKYEIE